MQKCRFITFEGGEGSGKTTQMRRLGERLKAMGHRVVMTREPGGTPFAEQLREAILAGRARNLGPFAEALLFSAARIDHIDHLIRPELARGAFVLCDRFADSTRIYQGQQGGVDPTVMSTLEQATLYGLVPDLTLILDLPAETGLARAQMRRKGGEPDRFEGETLAFHQSLRASYRALATQEPDRCVQIDADMEPEAVADVIWSVVRRRLSWPSLIDEAAENGFVA